MRERLHLALERLNEVDDLRSVPRPSRTSASLPRRKRGGPADAPAPGRGRLQDAESRVRAVGAAPGFVRIPEQIREAGKTQDPRPGESRNRAAVAGPATGTGHSPKLPASAATIKNHRLPQHKPPAEAGGARVRGREKARIRVEAPANAGTGSMVRSGFPGGTENSLERR